MSANILETLFPNLKAGGYATTSPKNADYNCIAWASGDTRKWWEPFGERYCWPPGAENSYSLTAYSQAFAVNGYAPCDEPAPEAGFEKIAIYVDLQGIPTHAARQLSSGKWTSKIGKLEDIEHDSLQALEGKAYGTVALVMKRTSAEW
ncbi:MAG: DUF7689 domain-containing protein [Blastocatellia bacterium]